MKMENKHSNMTKEKALAVKYMIEKECKRFSLRDLCESWNVTTDDFYDFLEAAIRELRSERKKGAE